MPVFSAEMTDKRVTIIGGGVTGLSAALELAQFGIHVDVVELSGFLGGHAIQFTCKATDHCVRCGACVAEEKLRQALAHPEISLFTNSRLKTIREEDGFVVERYQNPRCIDPDKCNSCGDCFNQCPDGAIVRGTSASHNPFYSLDTEKCSHLQDHECGICQKSCSQNAIQLDQATRIETGRADAILMATGFTPFDPKGKPYGYRLFKNVVTNLEMEAILRQHGRALKPSDQTDAQRIAFVQCVGSRDKKLNHLWCSRVCCGAALRMAGLIKFRQPEVDITCFYIDIQTAGRDFEAFYSKITREIRFVRSIPGDIFEQAGGQLKVIFSGDPAHESYEEIFDMVVLSVGLCPNQRAGEDIEPVRIKPNNDGFYPRSLPNNPLQSHGVFVAGSATGPMGIAESLASAGEAASDVLAYLER